jgi:ATP-dependent helicase HepA
MGPAVGYSDWRPYRDLLLRAVRSTISEGLLRDALRAAKAWQEMGAGAHTRLVTTVEFLRGAEAARHKMIVFAGYPELADEVGAALSGAFGSDAVASFRTEHDLETKEANVQRFHQEPETWLLVSDESGGEGRNFQFAAEIVHVDTPWFVARVEQRIGRVDRLGRELVRPDVVSNVIYNDASAEAGLVHSYDEAIDVYHHSISGLEFALRDVERALITGAMEGGRDALTRGADQLAELVQRERQRDDAEAVLDEASYEASAAGRFRAIANSDRVDSSIEGAFVDYMRQLTQNRGARPLDTPFGQGAVWRFQPEQTCYGALPVDRDGSEVLVGNHDGTFRRRVAQAAPRLHFFNVADPLFNAVIRSLDRHPTGRAFAVELTAPSHGLWVGIECRFLASYDQRALGLNGGLRNRAEALFVPKPVAVFVDLEGNQGQDGEAIVRLRRRLEYTQRGQTWWDLADAAEALAAALGAETWPDAAARLIEQARAEARRRFSEALATPLAEEQARVAAAVETIRGTAHLDQSDAQAQADALEAYAAALPNWDVYLDAVGLVSINGKLRAGRPR